MTTFPKNQIRFFLFKFQYLFTPPQGCVVWSYPFMDFFSIFTRRESYRCGLTFSQSQSDLQECHSTSHLESQESKLLYQKKNTKISTEPFLPGVTKTRSGERGTRQWTGNAWKIRHGPSPASNFITHFLFCSHFFLLLLLLLLLFFLFPFILPVGDIPGSLYFSSLSSMTSFRSRPVN